MALIKCKMCGGNIEVSADKTYGTCDSCGSTMTFPKVSDEQRANLFNRANHFRRQNEFDKAVSAYERILDEDNTDAEAHWGVVLSRYGIEYVEDPVSHERIPTCHRVQSTSILTDDDYLMAKQYAPDSYSAQLYEKEAQRIAEIQKGILAISNKEKPYDVFICYKESTEGGTRTKDSTIAQDIYYQLKQEGLKVFFSRITLEDKLGQQYEPYIFAALNSAKVMLVVGTKPEYFNAVWVKNEWSRYLAIMKQDRSRLLIPCYRDMDAYDLPEELSALQSQDMSKIGFMQDLIRGVKKVLTADKPKETVKAAAPVAAASPVAPLLMRVNLFLEDGDWQSADEYCERVLDLDPQNAQAYIGKMLAAMKVHKEADLAQQKDIFVNYPLYQKALRFADDKYRAVITGYNQAIIDRKEAERKAAEEKRKQDLYDTALGAMKCAQGEDQYTKAAKYFKTLGQYKDAEKLVKQCEAKAAKCHKDEIYQRALQTAKHETILEQRSAIALFQQIPDWQDSTAQIEQCEIRIKQYEEEAEKARLHQEKIAKRKKWIKAIFIILLVMLIVTGFFMKKQYENKEKYDAAMALFNNKQYLSAADAFGELTGYKDAYTMQKESRYQYGISLKDSGDYEKAADVFLQLGTYLSSKNFRTQCIYLAAIEYQESENYSAALELYNKIKYSELSSDVNSRIEACEKGIEEEKYNELCRIFEFTPGLYVWNIVADDYIDVLSATGDYYLGDYSENFALFPCFHLKNNSSSKQTVKITAKYDGNSLKWTEKEISSRNSHGFYTERYEVGTHTIVWYVNDIEVATATYTIHGGTNPEKLATPAAKTTPVVTPSTTPVAPSTLEVMTANLINVYNQDKKFILNIPINTKFSLTGYDKNNNMFSMTYTSKNGEIVEGYVNGVNLKIEMDGKWVGVTANDIHAILAPGTVRITATPTIKPTARPTFAPTSTPIPGITVRTIGETVYLRNAKGQEIERLPRGATITLTSYNESRQMFTAVYNDKQGYIKGSGLRIEKNGTWQDVSKDELVSYFITK